MPSSTTSIRGGHDQARPTINEPLIYSGSLDIFQHTDLTPVIGREYTGLQIAQVLLAEDRDRIIKDVAITGEIEHPISGLKKGYYKKVKINN